MEDGDGVVPASSLGDLDERWLCCWSSLEAVLPILAPVVQKEAERFLAMHLEGFAPCTLAHSSETYLAWCGTINHKEEPVSKAQWKEWKAAGKRGAQECAECEDGSKRLRVRTCGDDSCKEQYVSAPPDSCAEHGEGKELATKSSGSGECDDCEHTAHTH